jgi:hypothetical protein
LESGSDASYTGAQTFSVPGVMVREWMILDTFAEALTL